MWLHVNHLVPKKEKGTLKPVNLHEKRFTPNGVKIETPYTGMTVKNLRDGRR